MNGLQLERLCFLPSNVATMEYALSVSLDYMSQRMAFGRSIDKFEVIRHKVSQFSKILNRLSFARSEVGLIGRFVGACIFLPL